VARFFVVTPIGFEKNTLHEMREVWAHLLGKNAQSHDLPFPEVQILKGGLEFETEWVAAVQLNFFLKTASRILLRLTTFRTRDFPKFYQKVKALPWGEYLVSSQVEWVVNAQKSRLNNEKRLQESAEQALQSVLPPGTPGEISGTIHVRMDDDECTVSLDTTGEHLHKRGWSVLKGEAPLRETVSVHLLELLSQGKSVEDKAKTFLVDPMMGSGTFLTEARALYDGQFQRPFAFQKLKKCPKLFQMPGFSLNYRLPETPNFKFFVGYDISAEMTEVAKKNYAATEAQIADYRRKKFLSRPLTVRHKNSLIEGAEADRGGWVISNPPYGERLTMALEEDGLKGIVDGLIAQFQPERLGLLYPAKDRLKKAPVGYKLVSESNINNGGIHTVFTVLEAQKK
jgi:putative N6-adenine-specific DNA methylase